MDGFPAEYGDGIELIPALPSLGDKASRRLTWWCHLFSPTFKCVFLISAQKRWINTIVLLKRDVKWEGKKKKNTHRVQHSRCVIARSWEQFTVFWCFYFKYCNAPSLQLRSGVQPFLPTWYYASCGRHKNIAKSQLSCQTTGSSLRQICSASEKLQDFCWAQFKLKWCSQLQTQNKMQVTNKAVRFWLTLWKGK